jgi:AmiR/NasT family two-component response regulator
MAPNRFVNLRGLRAVVVHPAERDRDELTGQLSRIGLHTTTIWPCPDRRLPGSEFVLISSEVRVNLGKAIAELLGGPDCVVVAILDNESPTVIDKVVSAGVDAVIVKPFRARGLFSILVHAAHQKCMELERRKEVAVLQRKLEGFRKVEKAKEVLMQQLDITGDEAFAVIRRHSMDERMPVEDIASRIIDAERLLTRSAKMGSAKMGFDAVARPAAGRPRGAGR